MNLPPRSWTREILEQHSVDLRQFVDFRQSRLSNGMRVIEAVNSSGLTFTILPDRGLDIWAATFNGLPLSWISQRSPHPPDNGQPWLRLFNGGLLTTCGLTHVGPPEIDSVSGERRDIHGQYTRLRAGDIAATRQWVAGPDGEETYQVTLKGSVSEAALFGEQLRLERTYTLALGNPTIALTDTVWNCGDAPSPLMILYHCNVGFPLVSAGVQLHTAHHAVYPRDADARVGFDRWPVYDSATPLLPEQVFYHHPMTGSDGWSMAALLHDDWGLVFQWDTGSLPYLVQWKNTRQNIYVCGVEPGNCIPEGRNAAREKDRLVMLQPGETRTFNLRLTAIQGTAAVDRCREDIERLRQTGTAVADCQLTDYAQ